MKFKYIGDHSHTKLFGYTFPANVFVEVVEPHFQMKLTNNSHFENHQDNSGEIDEALKLEIDVKKKCDPDQEISREDLLGIAAERGIEVNKFWKTDRLRQEIENVDNVV